ncbi:MAG: ABC transporter ATP-binding protein [Fusicatenibacter sp.]|nr:ABC transporter ATP-binding protein [Fusicatenibacter sp.]
MAKKSDTITLKEALRLHNRSLKLLNGYCPGLFPATALCSVVSAVIPYVTIFLSARIISELAGKRRPEVIWNWVLAAVVCGGVLALAKGALERWKSKKEDLYYHQEQMIFTDKGLSMDFADVDRQTTRDLFSQIRQNESWSGRGMPLVSMAFRNFVESITGIFSAVALTASLFTSTVPESAGSLTALNHPLFLAAFAAVIVVAVTIEPWLASKGDAYWLSIAEDARLGNRIFSCFGILGSEHGKAMDTRIYNQYPIAEYYMNQSKTGILDRHSRGTMGILKALSEAMSAVLTGIVYVFVCLKAWAGAFGVGSVTQYVGAVTALTGNLARLLQTLGDMRNNAPFLKTVYEYLDIPNSMYQGSLTTEKRADRQYEVEFRNVSFKYPGASVWALKNVSMKFRVGSRLAIVGENGSGKTTFIKLLCRLYDPQEGQILLNGIDIRKYNYRDYMEIFSVVFQDFQLLSQPLGANVAGSAVYERQRVTDALTGAGFGERLAAMPDGLDTQLYKEFGENGVEVSGGEAQKIAIARALYKNAPFIILDEPTAALDPVAEAEIYSKFNEISGDKTAIYISHRLSSCKFCDEIAVFHEGAVIQQGTHAELVADTTGKYHELWYAQAQYYNEETA